MGGWGDGRGQRLEEKQLGAVNFGKRLVHFPCDGADLVEEQAFGDPPLQDDQDCYKDAGKPLRPRTWRTGHPLPQPRLVAEVVAGGSPRDTVLPSLGPGAPVPPGDGRWLAGP